MELTFDYVIELLEITDISKVTVEDIPKLEKKLKKRWHPDRVIHLNDPAITQEYTVKFQQIETACQMLHSYLQGTYHGGEAFAGKSNKVHEQPEEVIRRNAPEMQSKLRDLWNSIKAKRYKWSVKEVLLSDGFKLRDLLHEDFKEDIAMLSVVSFFYGVLLLGLLSAIGAAIHPVVGGILAFFTLLQALSCFLGLLPLSRFWLPKEVNEPMLWFINFGLKIYNWAENESRGGSGWVQLLIAIPNLFALALKYIVLFPLYELAKIFVGDKIVGIVKQKVNYYAEVADWYIDELISKDPNQMNGEELFHLSHIYSELSDAGAYTPPPSAPNSAAGRQHDTTDSGQATASAPARPQKNNKVVAAIVIACIALSGAAYFLLRPNPAKDGKEAAIAYCNCAASYNDEIIKADEVFIRSFNSYAFRKRQDARNQLNQAHGPADQKNINCSNAAQQKYNELRNQYANKQSRLLAFDNAYGAQSMTCNPPNYSKRNSLAIEASNKITSIIDPQPDIEKIKSDLIGQKIPGWNFSFLNEYQSSEILNTLSSNDRVEYQVKFHLRDNAANTEHDCEVMTSYVLTDQGWSFSKLKMIYITFINVAPFNQWKKVNLLPNCRYTILDQGHNYWALEGSGFWGKKYKGGPAEPAFTLNGNDISIASREKQPVELIFKYSPNY